MQRSNFNPNARCAPSLHRCRCCAADEWCGCPDDCPACTAECRHFETDEEIEPSSDEPPWANNEESEHSE